MLLLILIGLAVTCYCRSGDSGVPKPALGEPSAWVGCLYLLALAIMAIVAVGTMLGML